MNNTLSAGIGFLLELPMNFVIWLYFSYHSHQTSFFVTVEQVTLVAYHQEQKFKHFCPLHLGIRVAKENPMQSRTGWNTSLLTQKRRRARSASVMGACPPQPEGPSRQPPQSDQPTGIPPVPQNEGPHPLPTGTDIVVVPFDTCLNRIKVQNRERYSHSRNQAQHRL